MVSIDSYRQERLFCHHRGSVGLLLWLCSVHPSVTSRFCQNSWMARSRFGRRCACLLVLWCAIREVGSLQKGQAYFALERCPKLGLRQGSSMQIVVKLYIHHCYGIAHKKLIDWIDRDAVCRADLCDHKDHVAKLTYAASSWWDFTTAEDR